jgi:hypothetical protein
MPWIELFQILNIRGIYDHPIYLLIVPKTTLIVYPSMLALGPEYTHQLKRRITLLKKL